MFTQVKKCDIAKFITLVKTLYLKKMSYHTHKMIVKIKIILFLLTQYYILIEVKQTQECINLYKVNLDLNINLVLDYAIKVISNSHHLSYHR